MHKVQCIHKPRLQGIKNVITFDYRLYQLQQIAQAHLRCDDWRAGGSFCHSCMDAVQHSSQFIYLQVLHHGALSSAKHVNVECGHSSLVGRECAATDLSAAITV